MPLAPLWLLAQLAWSCSSEPRPAAGMALSEDRIALFPLGLGPAACWCWGPENLPFFPPKSVDKGNFPESESVYCRIESVGVRIPVYPHLLPSGPWISHFLIDLDPVVCKMGFLLALMVHNFRRGTEKARALRPGFLLAAY